MFHFNEAPLIMNVVLDPVARCTSAEAVKQPIIHMKDGNGASRVQVLLKLIHTEIPLPNNV